MDRTVKELLFEAKNELRSITDTPSLDASILFEKACGLNKVKQITFSDKLINEAEQKEFFQLIKRRLNHEPIAYIISKKEFYGRDFIVSSDTLIPRADTETLVEATINYINTLDYKPDVLDLCTGTGCVGLSVALETNLSSISLCDISDEALKIAQKNAKALYSKEINFIKSDLLENCKNYDIIVSNPPYLTNQWCEELDEDVKKEPILALEGFGQDGLDIIRKIITSAKSHFNSNKNAIFLECDSRQCNTVKYILEANSFKEIEIFKDLANRDRVVKGIYER
ncbi:MAG: peptide chain release factor N(5)-glutamine methyltransferase [Pleomorphochaeta sp.]